MKRRFSDSEREFLFALAKGRCMICKCALGPDFHADHIVPWIKGGITSIENGQALCPDCNLKKGTLMPYPFKSRDYAGIAGRKWQLESLARLSDRVNNGIGQHLVVACPGSGKTRLAIAFAKMLLTIGEIEFIIIVSPKNTIRTNWRSAFKEHDKLTIPTVKSRKISLKNMAGLLGNDGISTTYQSMVKSSEALSTICKSKKTMVILDEVHWARSSSEIKSPQAFGSSLEAAFSHSRQILSLSGTPWRTDRCKIPFIDYDSLGFAMSSGACSYSGAVSDKVCRSVIFRRMGATLRFEHERYGEVTGDLKENTLARKTDTGGYLPEDGSIARGYLNAALSPKVGFGIKLIEQANEKLISVRKRHPKAGGLIVAKGKAEADELANQMREKLGIDPVVIHSGCGDSDDVESFSASDAPWVISVDMITEGTDIPRLRVLVHLHNSMTNLFFIQLIGRIVRYEDHLEGDQVSYVFMPDYGPLDLMARDIEQEISIPADPDADPGADPDDPSGLEMECIICGGPVGQCDCPQPLPLPKPFFDAISSQHENMAGSITHGDDFLERYQARVDGMADDPEAAKYDEDLRLQFVRMFDDKLFMEQFTRSMTADEYADFLDKMEGLRRGEQAKQH